MKKLIIASSLIFSATTVFAQPAKVGDKFVLKQSVNMEKQDKLRVPTVNIRDGKVIADDQSSSFSCSISPNGDQFENTFGDARSYSSVALSPKVFHIIGVHQQADLGSILTMESSAGGVYTLNCSRYTDRTSVEFSSDTSLINSSCGDLCEIMSGEEDAGLTGNISGSFWKKLEL